LQFRDLFLQRLTAPDPAAPDRGFDVVSLATAVAEPPDQPFPVVRIAERTSWSCHHGVARWYAECPDAADGRWKNPLRAAFERLAGAIDLETELLFERLPGSLDPWQLRDAWVDVVVGAMSAEAFVAERAPSGVTDDDRKRIARVMEAQRWRLAMFASDGWFWDDPIRLETRQVLRAAARAVRIIDEIAGTGLERRLIDDLSLFVSPSRGLNGTEIYRTALTDLGPLGVSGP
jgi:hypothetical protein